MDLDVFPCVVTGRGTRWHEARALVSGDRFILLMDSRGGPKVAADVQLAPEGFRRARLSGESHVLRSVDGEEFTIEPGGGCGCGSTLKRARPAEYFRAKEAV